jgi:hypothetical protein
MNREEALKKAQTEEHSDISQAIDTFMQTLEIERKDLEEAKTKSHLQYL